ncbi:2-oxoisovalerate dehydrogenase subunit beta [uncultured Ruminococcus sp.]|uniref:Alpha-ketoacid dehydrogenase subunit beta n=1 Tax=Massiliimalia timonensis TaxID=1987501 RepID=A0A8J6PFC1_9FIRM|nr:alpha-ketoacid dehydrogenase subunit beta [Massiliimalia timonensis]MBC8611281.1 alpha-ketoacid dehydrogenase subunit beta [Massiliimalia timonensis]SCH06210.1 2-oxoisovalerate dehydrogenase subunit beta [uncultured Clostridium sp.]SCI02321.1 2-oxoisovalerate dehydrogenase subunit beta [uncultured Ruminococcus sp.]
MSRKTMSAAIAMAQREEMLRDESVYIMGLDVGPYGGAFGCTRGLWQEFGRERVMDMPISEAGYVGAAVGSAMTNMRPIAELQFTDWITIASDMLVNQAANMRYTFGGSLSVPMVLRAPVGGYMAAASQHSHMFESWFSFIPGLKVVLPSNPADAKGLLKSAIRDNNPVLFFEHKMLYDIPGEVPDDPEFLVPLGKANVVREGSDVTIATYAYMVDMAKQAAEILEKDGIHAEIIDLRTIKPMDTDTVITSVKKTNRLCCLQETWLTCSVASQISAVVAEEALEYLDAPILRIGALDAPNPFSAKLERYILPSVERIVREIREMF